MQKIEKWLPTTKKELEQLGWTNCDVILFSGDSYIDHPSFGTALIGRLIENQGLKVAINSQPNWLDDLRDFKKLGTPNLFFGVSAGSMDSMVNHYTATKRLRSNDAYTAGNEAGFRPDSATQVYTNILKKLFPTIPVIIGGVEASMRRLAHYDYWADKVFPSILVDSNADLLIYGMAEKTIKELISRLMNGENISDIKNLNQTAYKTKSYSNKDAIFLPSFEECVKSKIAYAEAFRIFESETNKINSNILVQPHKDFFVVINPPYKTMTTQELDEIYKLPFTRLPHPKYNKRGAIPAFEMIKNSINIHRGCFGGCSFCTISAHQGRQIVSRSQESIIEEVNNISETKDFNGHITDLGGPSANMYKMKPKDENICIKCKKNSCIFPIICINMDINHLPLIELYKKASSLKNIKFISIGSGIRYDMLISADKVFAKQNWLNEYIELLIEKHVSGRLKVAPEHSDEKVLKIMRKPSFESFKKFRMIFQNLNIKYHKNQQIIPYFISSHPGSDMFAMANLAKETAQMGYKLEQVQDFTPTPMTLSTTIYYCGFDPYTNQKIYTPKNSMEKNNQRKFFFWYKKENKNWIINELKKLKLNNFINIFYKKW